MISVPSLLGWGTWFGFAGEYIAAALLIAGGIYLAVFFSLAATNPLAWILRPLRVVGYALIGLGIAVACITYGKTLGAAECEAAWRTKNLEAQIERLKQEADAKAAAARAAQESLREIADEKEKTDAAVADYQVAVARLEASVAACRRASGDDDRRVCAILGAGAAGCSNSR